MKIKLTTMLIVIAVFMAINHKTLISKELFTLSTGMGNALSEEYTSSGISLGFSLFQIQTDKLLFGIDFQYNSLGPNEDEISKDYPNIDWNFSGNVTLLKVIPSFREQLLNKENFSLFLQNGIGFYGFDSDIKMKASEDGLPHKVTYKESIHNFKGRMGINLGLVTLIKNKIDISAKLDLISDDNKLGGDLSTYFALSIGYSFYR